jgi:hypothetical protein
MLHGEHTFTMVEILNCNKREIPPQFICIPGKMVFSSRCGFDKDKILVLCM